MSSAVTSKAAAQLWRSRDWQWAAGGWVFFVAENALLSENRTWLIAELGDDRYHLVYGTLSTIATASIGYSYWRLKKQWPSVLKQAPRALLASPSPHIMAASWVFLTVGLNMATQALPKFQIPVGVKGSSLQVRCPFDFKEADRADDELHGLERVTRHPGLWSLGLAGAGNALLLPTAAMPLAVWFTGPALVAWLGGAHTDSRFRRGMGGTLDPVHDSKTSSIPFAALLTGQQGNLGQSLSQLATELKPINAALATVASTIWVVVQSRRFRLR